MTVAIIPSRYGSSRLEGKPLIPVRGKPLIQRVYEQAMKSESVTRAFVATDDDRIVKAVQSFGGQAVMTSGKCRSGTDRVAECACLLDLPDEEIIANIQGDQPVFNPMTIDELIAPFSRDPRVNMTTLAFRILDEREITDPKDIKTVFDRNGFALYFSRAQIPYPRDGQKDVAYYKHLGFYAYRKHFLDQFADLAQGEYENVEKLEQLRILEFGYRIKVVVTEFDSPEIDLPEDIRRIEKKLSLT